MRLIPKRPKMFLCLFPLKIRQVRGQRRAVKLFLRDQSPFQKRLSFRLKPFRLIKRVRVQHELQLPESLDVRIPERLL